MNKYYVYYKTTNSYSSFEVNADFYITVDKLILFKANNEIVASFSVYNILGVVLQPKSKPLTIGDLKDLFDGK